MRLLLCWICPPLAVLFCWRPFSAVFNFVLTMFGWVPGIVHAKAVYMDFRRREMVNAVHNPRWARGLQQDTKKYPSWHPKYDHKARKGVTSGNTVLIEGKRGKQVEAINDPLVGANGTKFKRARR